MRVPFSKLRHDLLASISHKEVPQSARDLHQQFHDRCNLSTIYRALNFLEKNGLVVGFSLFCSAHDTMRYYIAAQSERHIHFLHCRDCHHFIPLESCNAETLQREIEETHQSQVISHVLYFIGICRQCLAAKKSAANLRRIM